MIKANSGFQLQEKNPHAIALTYSFSKDNHAKTQTQLLFPAQSKFPTSKTLSFPGVAGGMKLLVHYSGNEKLMAGLPTHIA